MYEDRLIFEKKILSNGLCAYTKKTSHPFFACNIVYPFGHHHNDGNKIPFGGFHFLEHCTLNRSKKFPQKSQFFKEVELKGAGLDAYVTNTRTHFSVLGQLALQEFLLDGILSALYEPMFNKSDIEKERTIVLNERMGESMWYPGDTEADFYIDQHVVSSGCTSLDSIFGTKEILDTIDEQRLFEIRKAYYSNQMIVVCVGSFDENILYKKFETIPLVEYSLPKKQERYKVLNSSPNPIALCESERFILSTVSVIEDVSFWDVEFLNFYFTYLTNPIHGPLYTWLREECGAVYGLQKTVNSNHNNQCVCGISFPMSNRQDVEYVKTHYKQKVQEALKDTKRIQAEVERVLNNRVYYYQRLLSYSDDFISYLFDAGYLITESMQEEKLQEYTKEGYVKKMVEGFMAKATHTEFVITPKNE